MVFEWDERKNRKKYSKHRIRFERAILIWEDEKRIVRYDVDHSGKEERWQVIGWSGTVLFIVFTEITEERIRVISARKANKREQYEYYKDYDIR